MTAYLTDMKIPIIFQDEYLIVVDKPVDLPVHKNDFMPHDAPYLTKLIGEMTGKWIYNVHRLDSKTSGVIVLAFSSEAANLMTKMFELKEVEKNYNAVVQGNPGSGVFDRKVLVKKKTKIKKTALTRYQTVRTIPTNISYKDKENIELSLVKIIPETGRWHQIRQHFAQHHHDILGDTHHGDFTLNKIVTAETGVKRLFLHAAKLAFKHPFTGESLVFQTGLPAEFDQVLNHYALKG